MRDSEEHRWAGELFIACMFLGIGIGVILGVAGAGTLVGIGVGFILASIVERTGRRYVLKLPKSLSSLIPVVVGAGFILGGLGVQQYSVLATRYAIAVSMIIVGILVLATSIVALRKKT